MLFQSDLLPIIKKIEEDEQTRLVYYQEVFANILRHGNAIRGYHHGVRCGRETR